MVHTKTYRNRPTGLNVALVLALIAGLVGGSNLGTLRASASGSCSLPGDGTFDSPFQVSTSAGLDLVPGCVDFLAPSLGYFELTDDIDRHSSANPLPKFAGTLDGNGYTIHDIGPTTDLSWNYGLFAVLSDDSTFSNLVLSGAPDADSNNSNIGVLAGNAQGNVSLVSVSLVASAIEPTSAEEAYSGGGFIGYVDGDLHASNVQIQGFSTSNVISFGSLAGVVEGDAYLTQISADHLALSASAGVPAGGLVGWVYGDVNGVDIEISNSRVDKTGNHGTGLAFGLVEGRLSLESVSIVDSSVLGESVVGGITGWAEDLSASDIALTRVRVQSDFEGTSIGGIAGEIYNSASLNDIEAFQVTTEARSSSNVAGLIGEIAGHLVASEITLRDMDASGHESIGLVGGLVASATLSAISVIGGYSSALSDDPDEGSAGGLIGFAGSSIELAEISISGITITGDSYLGAAIGRAMEDVNFSGLEASGVFVSGQNYLSGGFGHVEGALSGNAFELESSIVGFFGYAGGLAAHVGSLSVSGIVLSGNDVMGQDGVGGVVGHTVADATIQNVSVDDLGLDYSDSKAGGVLGFVGGDLDISQVALSDLTMSGRDGYAGGLVGRVNGSSLLSQIVISNVTLENTDERFVGGIAGDLGDVIATSITITNVTVSASGVAAFGFPAYISLGFGEVGDSTISFVAIANSEIHAPGSNSVGGLIGLSSGVTNISEVNVAAITISSGIDGGGIIGSAENTFELRRAILDGSTILATDMTAGGLIGFSWIGGEIENFQVTDSFVRGTGDQDRLGLVVGNSDGWLDLNLGIVRGSEVSSDGESIGGIVGLLSEDNQGTALADIALIDLTVSGQASAAGAFGTTYEDISATRLAVSNVTVDSPISSSLFIGSQLGAWDDVEIYDSYFLGSLSIQAQGTGLIFGHSLNGFEGLTISNSVAIDLESFSDLGADPQLLSQTGLIPRISTASFTDVNALPDWNFESTWGFDTAIAPAPLQRSLFMGLNSSVSQLVPPVISSGQDQQQPSPTQAAYSGPVVKNYSNGFVAAGELLTIFGSRLETVTEVRLSGQVAELVEVGASFVTVRIPAAGMPGRKDLELLSSFGKLTILSAVSLLAPPPTSVENVKRITVTSFGGRAVVYLKGYEADKISIRFGGRWFSYPSSGKSFQRLSVKSRPGNSMLVSVYISGVFTEQLRIVIR